MPCWASSAPTKERSILTVLTAIRRSTSNEVQLVPTSSTASSTPRAPIAAEVVHGDVLDHRVLGHLDGEPARLDPGPLEGLGDGAAADAPAQLDERQVDGQLDVLRPGGRLLAALGQHPLAELDDVAVGLEPREQEARAG